MRYRRFIFIFVGVFAQLFTLDARSYTRTVSVSGTPIRWGSTTPYLALVGNTRNSNGLSPTLIFQSVVNSLTRWKNASENQIHFDYWQGEDPNQYPSGITYDGLSSLSFLSSSGNTSGSGSQIIGLTQLWYNTQSGILHEADIVLNDLSFKFTNNPKDTTGFGNGQPNGLQSKSVFMENVLTHELGHAFGLAHSGSLQSSMLFLESPEQAFLGCDDQVAIQVLYPKSSQINRGSIRGQIFAPGGKPIFGAHVLAISFLRGTVLASTVTDSQGVYAIDGLVPGEYVILAEPFSGGAQVLPAYYQTSSSQVCGGQNFKRTLLTTLSNPNHPQLISVVGGEKTQVASLTVSCSGTGVFIPKASGTDLVTTAPQLFDGTGSSTQNVFFSYADRLNAGEAYYRVDHISGDLKVNFYSYSLYSPTKLSVELLDEFGNALPATQSFQIQQPLYQGQSGYSNHDIQLVATGLPLANYILRVRKTLLSSAWFPAGLIALDLADYFVLSGQVGLGIGVQQSDPWVKSLPDGARCQMIEAPSLYQSPPGGPPRRTLATLKEEDNNGGFLGFCGTSKNSPNPMDPPTANGATIISWFLPWLFMLFMARLAKLRAHFSWQRSI